MLFLITTSFISYGQKLQLQILGKDSIQQKVIDSIYSPVKFENLKSINTKIDSISIKFQKLGFIEARLLESKKINDSVYHAKYNLKTKYHTIYIYNYKSIISKSILEQLSDSVFEDYFIIKISDIEFTLNFLNKELTSKGLPFSTVTLKNINKINNILKAELSVTKNKKREINKVIVKGYENFPKSFIKHYLKILPKDNLNLNELKIKSALLENLNFVNETKTPEIQFTKDSTTVYLYLERKKSNFFDGFLGFGTNEDNGKIEFNGYLDLNLINNLNFGESLNLRYKSNELEQRYFEANIEAPYILGSPLGAKLSLNIFKKDSTFTTTNQKVNVFYNINPKNEFSLGYNSIQSNLIANQELVDNLSDYKSRFFNATYKFINQTNTNRLFPISAFSYISIGLGNRNDDLNKIRQSLVEIEAYKSFYLNSSNSIFLRIESKGIFSDNYLENELFRFGGINSIRGFQENSLIANTYGIINTEYRYQLSSSIYLHSIIDLSYLENDLSNIKEKLFGFGFGFGIKSNAGLLKFNYANGKSENQQFKLSNSKVHISFNAEF